MHNSAEFARDGRQTDCLFRIRFHPAQGTVPVIIEFFVQRRPLVDFHQSDVGNQTAPSSFLVSLYTSL